MNKTQDSRRSIEIIAQMQVMVLQHLVLLWGISVYFRTFGRGLKAGDGTHSTTIGWVPDGVGVTPLKETAASLGFGFSALIQGQPEHSMKDVYACACYESQPS